ncbi:hypothetical protein WJX75_001083 [Coccomyxa subellipsoidea]|uniref:Protein kinase domain-containing protein n=1 Tax=Coccomyxa subellipsoidea TaxID=248742 RepID=A0ABR2YKN6_9CHLO
MKERRYIVRDMLGQGTFGQVVRCCREDTREEVAVKVIKNQTAFYHQARVEVGVLQFLNTRGDPENRHHIVRMRDFFVFRNHLCLVFELLSVNLYELVKHNQFRGLSMNLLRVFINQILDALSVLHECNIIHCDLKPENVLLKGLDSGEIKVIDFGSACFENRTMYSYIQSRFYRSPEVLLGYPYDVAIDMWSLGCMAAELYLGLPLFPGASEHDLLVRIVEMLGMPPPHVLGRAQHLRKYFKREDELLSVGGVPMRHQKYRLRTQAEFEALHNVKAPAGKRYFQHTKLPDIIGAYPFRSGLSEAQLAHETERREAFLDFLMGVLDLDPEVRWSPQQALRHPFLTGERFTGPFQPPPQPHMRARPAPPPPRPDGQAALSPYNSALYKSPVAAILATSPEFHAQAHAAAMAAVQAHFSPRGAGALGASLGTSQQQNSFEPAMAAASALAAVQYSSSQQGQNGQPQHTPSGARSQQAQRQHSGAVQIQQQVLQGMQFGSFDPMYASGHRSSTQTDTPYGTPYGSFSSLSSMQTPPHSLSGYSPMTHLPGLASSYHSTPGRSGGPASSLQGTPMATSYNSYSYIAAAAAAASAQQAQQQQPVVGSLEALRANAVWNMPHGPAFQNGQPNAAYLGTSHARLGSGAFGDGLGSHQDNEHNGAQQPADQRATSGMSVPQAPIEASTRRVLTYQEHLREEELKAQLAERTGGDAAEGSGRPVQAASTSDGGVPSSSEGRANISRTQSQDVGPTPSDWDPSYSDDLLLSDDAGWGGFPDGRPRQTASRALLPRFAETAEPAPIAAARQLPGSYADSLTSPVQPSPQGPYDTHWLRCNGDVRHAATDAPLSMLPGSLIPKAPYTSIGFASGKGAGCK